MPVEEIRMHKKRRKRRRWSQAHSTMRLLMDSKKIMALPEISSIKMVHQGNH
jgi:hypothetical protein